MEFSKPILSSESRDNSLQSCVQSNGIQPSLSFKKQQRNMIS